MSDRTQVSDSLSRSRTISIVLALSGIVLSIAGGLFLAGMANALQLLIVLFGVIAFFVTFTRMDLGVIAMIFILYTQAYIIIGERYGITNIVQGMIMMLVLAMATRWTVYSYEMPQGWMLPLFLIFFYCMIGVISVFFSEDQEISMSVAIEMVKSGIIALSIAMLLKNNHAFRLAMWTLLWVGIVLGSLSIFQFVTGTYGNDYGGYAQAALQNIAGETNDYRAGGPVGDPNYFAQMMVVMVPIAMDRLWNERNNILRLLAALSVGICAFSVILTYSRGGFLAMVVVIAAMLFIFHRGQLHYFIFVLALAMLFVNILPSRFTERLATLTALIPGSSNSDAIASDYSFRGRYSELIVSVKMFYDHPVLGVGLGNYSVLYQRYSQRLGIDLRAEERQAHSLYLEVAAETGLLGVFSFGLLLWLGGKMIWKAQLSLTGSGLTSISNMVMSYALGFVGYLTAAIFIHQAYPRNFWILVGIALSIPRMSENEIESSARVHDKSYHLHEKEKLIPADSV